MALKCMMSDLCGDDGSVTGVDISRCVCTVGGSRTKTCHITLGEALQRPQIPHVLLARVSVAVLTRFCLWPFFCICRDRLASCRTLLQKYNHSNARLFLDNGCTFSVGAPQRDGPMQERGEENKREDERGDDEVGEQHQRQHLQREQVSRAGRRKVPKKDRKHYVNGMFFCASDLLSKFNLDTPSKSTRLYDKVRNMSNDKRVSLPCLSMQASPRCSRMFLPLTALCCLFPQTPPPIHF